MSSPISDLTPTQPGSFVPISYFSKRRLVFEIDKSQEEYNKTQHQIELCYQEAKDKIQQSIELAKQSIHIDLNIAEIEHIFLATREKISQVYISTLTTYIDRIHKYAQDILSTLERKKNIALSAFKKRFFINIERPFARGAFSELYEGVDSFGKLGVMKVNLESLEFFLAAKKEKRILKDLNSKRVRHIVKLRDSVKIGKLSIGLILEHLDFSLEEIELPLDITRTRLVAIQLLKALKNLKDNRYVHNDLKPNNIMVKKSCKIRFIDFGLSCIDGERPLEKVQNKDYRSPESALGLPLTHKSDVWSIACILIKLFTGVPAFSCIHDDNLLILKVICSILGTEIPDHMKNKIDASFITALEKYFISQVPVSGISYLKEPLFRDLIGQMLRINPEERISASMALEHPFFHEEAMECPAAAAAAI